MIDYSKLPTEILTIIFEYLDPDRVITSTKKNIIQCQHTCKSWAVVAKTNLYQKIGIQYNSNAANLFFNTLLEHNLGYLVKSITIYGLKKKHNNRILLSNLVSQIGDLCPNLKNFSVKYPFISVDFWKCIQSERSKGAFSKLQVATIPLCFRKNKVNQYYKAAYSLKDTLIELRILPRVPIENLESFKNINTLYFPIDNSNEIYKIDQHIKVCPSVKFININPTGNTKVYPLNNDINGSSVNICPQVRQLLVKDIQFDNELFGYVMNVFPNLNELNIRFKTKSLPKRLNKTSNEIALQFLSYLMKIPNASVNIFPVEDVESLLKNFQDISGINRNLSITYQKNTTIPNSLTLSTNRRGINILVNSSNNEYLNLPRIGMIEKSGKRLQSITLNMGINYKHMNDLNGMDALNNGIDVYPIFLYCPNLKSIHILHTPLCFLGMHVRQEEKFSLHSVTLESSIIHDSFFSRFSHLTKYINTLTIRDINLFKKKELLHTNRYIDMPGTKLNSIHYRLPYSLKQLFLKLRKTRDNNTDWFAYYDNHFQKSSREKYEASLRNQNSFSLFICCQDILTIECEFGSKSIVFKT